MKERHERETALKGERDLQAKGAADREAALQVKLLTACGCSTDTVAQLSWAASVDRGSRCDA